MTTKENMRSHTDVCGRIKELGFAPSKRVRMYGESFEIVSEPFPEGDGISVYAITGNDPQVRTLRLPLSVLGLRELPVKVA